MMLYFLRHMQTPDNLAGTLQGRRDTAIIPPGPDQADQIEENKAKIGAPSRFDHILVSRLRRTHETAALYTKEFQIEPLLDELDFGPWEGRPRSALLKDLPLWETDPSGLVLGEPVTDLADRIKAFTRKYQDAANVLAFGHGAWIRAFCAIRESGSLSGMNQLTIPNNHLCVFSMERSKT